MLEDNLLCAGSSSKCADGLTLVGDKCIVKDHKDCGKMIRNSDFNGFDIAPTTARPAANMEACQALCFHFPACNAVTFNKLRKVCYVKTIPHDLKPTRNIAGDSMRVCRGAAQHPM